MDDDIFPLQIGGKKISIITRTGIEKIQYHNNIDVTFSIESIDPKFIVIKAIAKKGDVQIETHGEASPQNTTQKYPVAMAEKRALSRVVLKICGAYQYGIFGEEESEDFGMADEDFGMERKKDDIPTGQLEAGNAGGYVDDAHPQLDGKYMAKFEDQSTLDLSTDNLEKAYRQFKAEQLEKMAYETVKGKFQKRFDTEMVAKEHEIVKAGYDAQSEVSQLKRQFSDLLKSLKDEKTTVIRKQEEAVEALNIPSPDTIAKMEWSEINQLIDRLENGV